MRRAAFQQLVPMPDRWEFQYLCKNIAEPPFLSRVPMLGLALIDFPVINMLTGADDGVDRVVEYFGPSVNTYDGQFHLYHGMAGIFDVYPFFQPDVNKRGLGVVPVGTPDDYFADEIQTATEELEAQQLYNNDWTKLFRAAVNGSGIGFDSFTTVEEGMNKFFRCRAGIDRIYGDKTQWGSVIRELQAIHKEGSWALFTELKSASGMTELQVEETR